MLDTNCPYHADHNQRIKKLETHYDELDDRVTALDKDFAVSKTEIFGAIKSLDKLPDTMNEIGKTMRSMQEEIRKSNDRMEGMEAKLTTLDNKMTQIDEDGKFNIRLWLKRNWISILVILAILGYLWSDILKGVFK